MQHDTESARSPTRAFETLSRRAALAGALGAAACWSARSWWSTARAEESASPNGQIRVGVIGTGVRGKYLIGNLPPSARVVALCDCAKSNIANTLQPHGVFREVLDSFANEVGPGCRSYQDYRQMIDREKLDAVIIATPDHHHAEAGLRALHAGLDVYLEKPLTVTIHEGRVLADAVARTGRVLQVGSQQRTMEMNRFACEFIREGGLGRISRVDLPNYPGPLPTAKFPAEPIPSDLDWSLFLGPAPTRPHNRRLWVKDAFKVGDLLWRGWDLFRDYSGHIMTNWGAHSVDMMQYALGRDATGPVRIQVIKPASVAAIQQGWSHKTPAAANGDDHRFWPVRMWYADGVEVRVEGPNAAITFHGERGKMKIRRNHFEVDPPDLITGGPSKREADRWSGGGHVARPHLENWLECIRSRATPNAPVEVGHRTVTICHLANIARETERELRWDPKQERFIDNEVANRSLQRPRKPGFELSAD